MDSTGQKPTDHAGASKQHYIGAAGEHLVASYFMTEGMPVYWPALAGWVDLVVQTPHGFRRVQVKTCDTEGDNPRVRRLGSTNRVQPSDRYDLLAVVHKHRLWVIPSQVLEGKDTITLHPTKHDCPFAGFRRR
ncbi:hypothetical protein ACQU0X_08410 [Pseudovibrio ascidiaceicola]|uniref:hypothetical protein n=1 Tax=Pseudovibrio ascidiaceicola TaxID=285279 RepID=UPI003D364FEF